MTFVEVILEPEVWTQLAEQVPPEFRELCQLCYTFEENFSWILRANPYSTVQEFYIVSETISQIVLEYIRLIRTYMQSEADEHELVRWEIEAIHALAPFYKSEGQPKLGEEIADIGRMWGTAMRYGMPLKMAIAGYLRPSSVFIHTKIYQVIQATIRKANVSFGQLFAESVKNTIGSIPIESLLKKDRARFEKSMQRAIL